MACKPIIFDSVTREKFLAVRARIRAQARVETAGDSGTATQRGFTVQWIYNEPSQTLEVQCLSKPCIVSEGMVASKIRDMMTAL
jgi:hypothetical protein